MYEAGELTVAQIAAACGVTCPTIYRHLGVSTSWTPSSEAPTGDNQADRCFGACYRKAHVDNSDVVIGCCVARCPPEPAHRRRCLRVVCVPRRTGPLGGRDPATGTAFPFQPLPPEQHQHRDLHDRAAVVHDLGAGHGLLGR